MVVDTNTSKPSLPKIDHDAFKVGFCHLPVGNRHPSFRNQLLDVGGDPADRGHPVVDEKHLTFAQQFPPDGGHHLGVVVGAHKVRMGCRASGGVAKVDISRIPVTAISSVRGIGVALIAKTSTLIFSDFNRSLCSTPNRCSSSTTIRPKSLNTTFFPQQAMGPDDHIHTPIRQTGDGGP